MQLLGQALASEGGHVVAGSDLHAWAGGVHVIYRVH
jgi:hypothetical protein